MYLSLSLSLFIYIHIYIYIYMCSTSRLLSLPVTSLEGTVGAGPAKAHRETGTADWGDETSCRQLPRDETRLTSLGRLPEHADGHSILYYTILYYPILYYNTLYGLSRAPSARRPSDCSSRAPRAASHSPARGQRSSSPAWTTRSPAFSYYISLILSCTCPSYSLLFLFTTRSPACVRKGMWGAQQWDGANPSVEVTASLAKRQRGPQSDQMGHTEGRRRRQRRRHAHATSTKSTRTHASRRRAELRQGESLSPRASPSCSSDGGCPRHRSASRFSWRAP